MVFINNIRYVILTYSKEYKQTQKSKSYMNSYEKSDPMNNDSIARGHYCIFLNS